MAKKKEEAAAAQAENAVGQVENAVDKAAAEPAAEVKEEAKKEAGKAAEPEQSTVVAEAADDGGGTLERIEQLLIDQAKHNKKMLKSNRLHSAIMGVIAVIFAVIGIAFYSLVSKELANIQPLINNANALVQTAQTDLSQVVNNVNKIDFKAVNDAITGISDIDFEGINDSIQGLSKGVAAFQQVAENLSKPAFGLFG